MRTQEEIKLICDEISLAVKLALLREEQEKSIREIQHESILCYDPIYGACFRVNKEMIKAQIATLKMNKAFEDYKQKVKERL